MGGSSEISYDFFVDSVNGSDSNDGLTIGTAKQTITAAQALMSAGKNLALVRGSKWRETFTFQHANITIGVAGDESDPMPILDGRDVVATTWTRHDAGTYPDVWNVSWTRSQAASTAVSWINLWADNEFVRAASSIADCQTNGGAFYASRSATTTTVYIKSTTDPNSNGVVYEISKRGWAFNGHSTSLGVAAPANQQIVGPIEMVGFIEHYNAIAGGPGQAKRALITDGNVHHTVTEGDLCEDILMSRVIPGASGALHTAYRAVGTGFTHIARRCLALSPGGADRVGHGGFYAHGSTPTTIDSLTVDQCITQAMTISSDSAVLAVSNVYAVEPVLPTLQAGSTNVTVTINRVQIQELTQRTTGSAMAFRCLVSLPAITIDNLVARQLNGFVMTLNATTTPPELTNCSLIGTSANIAGGSGAQRAPLVLNYCVVIATNGRVLDNLAAPYVGNFNVFRGAGTGSTQPVFSIDGTVDSSLSAWQSRTGQDAQSVWLKGLDQNAGDANAFWLGVATNANAGPDDGDWRINPAAKVYNAAGTALFGTFADGTTPITLAGAQEHWNFNTRSVVAGPPTQLLTLPATKAEERQYVDDPEAWDFYA